MDLKGSWLQYFSFREIVYKNNYHASIKMTSYEACMEGSGDHHSTGMRLERDN